jgi:AraC-like DNA-binding protein
MRQFGINDLELIESLFDQLPGSPFFVKDEVLRYVAANQAMADLCGVPSGIALHGKRVGNFFPAELAESYEALDREVIASGHAITDVLHRSMEAGAEPAWLLFARIPVRAADGRCIGVAATSRRLRSGLVSEASYERLRLITARLRGDFDQPLRLDQLAEEAGTSPSQLERDFRRIFAMNPRDFLHRIRMQNARRLLEETSASVSAIAQDCGYADQSAFTRRFARSFGMAPRDYRRANRRQ